VITLRSQKLHLSPIAIVGELEGQACVGERLRKIERGNLRKLL